MKEFVIDTDPRVEEKYDSYPAHIRPRMNELRKLILESALKNDRLDRVVETLKWGEPSYLVKKGTTIRIDWKEKYPDQIGMYFQCTSLVIPTVRAVHNDTFRYDGTRAILLDLKEAFPVTELQECIQLALDYHLLKDKPLLGI